QEVGQAGRLAFKTAVTLSAPVTAQITCDPATPFVNSVVVGVNSIAGMWADVPAISYVMLTTLDGDSQETFRVAAVHHSSGNKTLTACFTKAHAAGTVLQPLGAFATGVVPPTGIVNGSSATVLKLFGDINADGDMVYVEYTCDTVNHKLYRNVMPFDAAS